MKLLTDVLKGNFQEIGLQEDVADPIVVARFFNASGPGLWLATSYDPETNMLYGFVSIFGDGSDEWGYFSLEELEDSPHPFVKIVRDTRFTPRPFSKAIKEVCHERS
jgi:hypothetical protein